jgi:dolichol-phosphate mannosyltransferase
LRILTIIPTYNERENIEPLLDAIFQISSKPDILVVDDSSPDGTGEIVRSLQKSNERLHLLSRKEKKGLGRAYIAGFEWGLQKGYDIIIEMDADFSHRPADLEKIIKSFNESVDFVVGSRYVEGGATVNWGVGRKILSRGGSFYARTILGFPLNDWTGGFNAWRRAVLEGIGLQNVKSEGYSFQVELKYRALKKNFKVLEVPIVFEDRRVGKSKMSSRIVFEAFFRVWKMRCT